MRNSFLISTAFLAAGLQAASPTPLTELPYTPSLDPTSMDRAANPCADFYRYSCGGWALKNPIPADEARWDTYDKLYNENQRYLWGLLETAAQPRLVGEVDGRAPAEKQIGDYFRSCMDETAIETAGIKPLQDELAAIWSIQSTAELAPLLGWLHRKGIEGLFAFGSEQDARNSESVIAAVYAGGLGLPDRDYYLKTDAKSLALLDKYRAHVAAMLVLANYAPEAAQKAAATIVALETEMARATLTRVEQRDPHKIYHLLPMASLQAMTPGFNWKTYISATGGGKPASLNVSEPAFFKKLGLLLKSTPLPVWKDYLRWHLVRGAAPLLSSPFVNENFNFYRAELRGVKELAPRWKRCVQRVDGDLGEALGRVFVEKTFTPETKARTVEMTHFIEAAMATRVEKLAWMSAATKVQAHAKLKTVRNKIGYPDKWRDYSKVTIDPADFFGNARRAARFETQRQLEKIGKPLDRDEWGMTPPTVNAYYNAQMNDINFPAGILQPPLFDPKLDDAPNYGNTGSTIGHELIHGFDDEGRQFDAKGNLRDWWSPADGKEFEKRAACVKAQYAGYTVVDDIKLNSALTLGEDIADLGGTQLAYDAWKLATAGKTLDPQEGPRDGLTPDQRFFVGLAQWACGIERDENKRLNAVTNPHSPAEHRVNGVVVNLPEFARAFSCPAGAPMVKEKVCEIW